MFIDRFGKEWNSAEQFAKDSQRSHSAYGKDDAYYLRYKREIELRLIIAIYREKGNHPRCYDPHKYFRGSLYDFIRFKRSGSECFHCQNLFKPTTTPEQIYNDRQKLNSGARQTHYYQYDKG